MAAFMSTGAEPLTQSCPLWRSEPIGIHLSGPGSELPLLIRTIFPSAVGREKLEEVVLRASRLAEDDCPARCSQLSALSSAEARAGMRPPLRVRLNAVGKFVATKLGEFVAEERRIDRGRFVGRGFDFA